MIVIETCDHPFESKERKECASEHFLTRAQTKNNTPLSLNRKSYV